MIWLNLFIFVLLAAGHTELIVTLVNRVHALRIHRETLRHLRHAHDLLLIAFPVLLVGWLGFGGPGLLTGGRWDALSWGWWLYFGLCGCGVGGLLFSSLRNLLRPIPTVQVANHSHIVDVAARLGYAPLVDGPYRRMARVPGNEIFQLEVSEKTYRLPRLPQEWDGLSILHLSDLHYIGTVDRPYFEQVMDIAADMQADLIVFTGDLLDRQELLAWLPETLGRLSARLGCYFILGNHDWEHGLDPDETRRALSDLGWQDTAGQTLCIDHNGRTLAIGGSECPWMGEHPDFSGAPEDAFRLLLSHTPDNLPWARRQGIDLMLSGHNHGGQVVLPGIGPVYAPSRFGVRYAGGVFWEDPTLMYVTRGISGQYPLRLNCRPELTKLILRSPEVKFDEATDVAAPTGERIAASI